MGMWALPVDMQKDLSNAARTRGTGRASLAGTLGVLAVLLATVAVASYPRVAVGATVGVAATALLRRWYTQAGTLDTPSAAERGADSGHGRTEQRDTRLANGRS